MFRFTVLALLGMVAQGFATNLVFNGGFESGNTGFSSDYTLWPIGRSGAMGAGYYSVVGSANQVHSGFSGAPQAGSKFFVANGAIDTTQAVWMSQVISVNQTNVAYRFEAYLSSVVPPEYAPPSLFFQIGDGTTWTTLGSTPSLAGAASGQWFYTFADASFGTPGDFLIRFRNGSNVVAGNDLGLDSIFFGLRSDAPSYLTNPGDANPTLFSPAGVPEPSAASLLMLGIGGLVALRRTRRSAV